MPVPPKLLVVLWEGADWPLLQTPLADGKLPQLLRLLNRSTHGNILGLAPFAPASLYASTLSGQRAWQHGVLHAQDALTTPLITEAVPQSLEVNTPLGASSTERCVSEAFFQQVIRTPKDALDSDDELAALCTTPATLDQAAFQLLCPALTAEVAREDPHVQLLAIALAELYSVHNVAASLLETEDWQLAITRFTFLETVQRQFGAFTPQAMSLASQAYRERYGQVVEGACRLIDYLLADLLQAAGEDTRIMLLSTRGQPVPHQLAHVPYPLVQPGMGMFAFAGEGIAREQTLGTISLLDIVPTLRHALGLPPQAQPEGRVLVEAFDPMPSDAPVRALPDSQPTASTTHDLQNLSVADARAYAISLYESDRHDAALPYLEHAITQAPESLDIAFWLACTQAKLGLATDATMTLAVMQELENEANRAFVRSLCALVAGQMNGHEEVIAQLEPLASEGQLLPVAAASYVEALIEVEEWAKASDYLQAALMHAPSPSVWLGLARCYLHYERYDDAHDALTRVLNDNPGLARAHLLMAEALSGQKKNDAAREAVSKAYRLAPDWPEVRTAVRTMLPEVDLPPTADDEGNTATRNAPQLNAFDKANLEATSYAEPTTSERGRLSQFRLPQGDDWTVRIWRRTQPFSRIVGVACWREDEEGIALFVNMRPSLASSASAPAILTEVIADIRSTHDARIIIASPDALDWQQLLPQYSSVLETWTNEDWTGDPHHMAEKLTKLQPRIERALMDEWQVRTIAEEDWPRVKAWGLEQEFFDAATFEQMRASVHHGLSGVVTYRGEIAGLLVATKNGRQAVLDFIVGAPDHEARWPMATLLLMHHLITPATQHASYDTLKLTTNRHRGDAMHKLAGNFGMSCTRIQYHALVQGHS